MPPLELTLMRHGQSEADLLGVIECNADFSLTQQGLAQVQALADYWLISRPGWAALYASPLARARESAAIVGTALGLAPIIDTRLAEKNVGEMAGLSRAEAAERYPVPAGGLLPHQRMGGGTGESLLQFRARVHEALWELRQRHAGERIAILAHGGVINEILRLLLASPEGVVFASGDAAWHQLSWGERVIVRALNQSAARQIPAG